MNTPAIKSTRSWLWIWLTLPPLAAVIGAIFTIHLALTHPDPVIHAATEKVGKTVVRDNQAALYARELGLQAQLHRDAASGSVRLTLEGDFHGDQIYLIWVHPTRPEDDRGAILMRESEHSFHGILPKPPGDHGVWILRDETHSWSLEAAAPRADGDFILQPVVR